MPAPISWKLYSSFGYSMPTFLDRFFFLIVTVFDFEKEFHSVIQAGCKLTSSCLSLLSARITCVSPCTALPTSRWF